MLSSKHISPDDGLGPKICERIIQRLVQLRPWCGGGVRMTSSKKCLQRSLKILRKNYSR